MSDVKWIKIVTDIFDDEKILLIETLPEADSVIVIWFKLLCLAGKQNNSGVFTLNGKIPYTDKMFATIFRRKETIVQLALQTFVNFGMIEIINDTITIPNWGKHQALDKIEAKNEYMRLYMQGYRQKQIGKANSKANSKANVSSAEVELYKEELYKQDNKKMCHFTPPTLDEIKAYCTDRKNKVDAERFIDFYTSKGWLVGKNPMKDWKACIRTWEKEREPQIVIHKQETKNKENFEQRQYSDDFFKGLDGGAV